MSEIYNWFVKVVAVADRGLEKTHHPASSALTLTALSFSVDTTKLQVKNVSDNTASKAVAQQTKSAVGFSNRFKIKANNVFC